MSTQAFATARDRLRAGPRTLLAYADTVWMWPGIPLTRIWFKERPINSREDAVEAETKAGNSSRLLSYSYKVSVLALKSVSRKYLNITINRLDKEVFPAENGQSSI